MRVMFNLFMKKKHVDEVAVALENVSKLCSEMIASGEQHEARILLEPA